MPLSLHQLSTNPGARVRRRRVGRGNASRGTYSGRGLKGQRSRSGGRRGLIRRSLRALLERVPKQRGFTSRHHKLAVVNLTELEQAFDVGQVVTPELLEQKGLVRTSGAGVKVLGRGTLSKKLTVRAHAFSASAQQAIAAAGGTVVRLHRRAPVAARAATTANEQANA
ncbi:MAG: 50S ribosomal protein L15 [Candidatus Kerfeldbacteria bacterium]|nr:50S ribosomal protein L15 [Candidatus Kerfeldbacteria bacterium]